MAKSEEGFKPRVPADRRVKDKCAIVGFTDHRSHAFDLPQDQWELWGINEMHRVPGCEWEKFARWFEVHPRKDIDTDAQHIETMGKMDIPVYMQVHHADIPASVAFPREELQKLSVQHFGRIYFTSSIAWQTALAIHMGYKAIHIYGVDMAQDTEYAEQRPCCEAWLGVAAGMGIEVYVPPTSDLLKTVGEYGFGEVGTEFSLKVNERTAWLHGQDNDFLNQVRAMDAEYPKIKERLEGERAARIAAIEQEAAEKLAGLESEYKTKRGHLWDQRNQVFGAILDCNFWRRSWAIPISPSREFSPDRTKDPRIGLKAPSDATDDGVSASKMILEGAAA